jgi:cellulose synthase/poly-beta-1,6-N-acetylglucosamine synthase-like glycosyltransferase
LDLSGLKVEFIFVDDHSTDESKVWLEDKLPALSFEFKLIHAVESGKKAALSAGIQLADSEIIVTTDSDVILPEKWLQLISRNFSENTKMMIMPVGIILNNLNAFKKYQALEVLALSSLGMGAVGMKIPVTANGANLAFEKKAFYEIGEYNPEKDFPGGDDEFLLHRMHQIYPESISAIYNPECMVRTYAADSMKELIQQRKRWIAKSSRHRNLSYRIMMITPVLMMILMLILAVSAPFSKSMFHHFIKLLGVKILTDFFFFTQIVDLQPELKKWRLYLLGVPFYQLLYMAGMFVYGRWHTFEWKKRNYGT